MGDLLLLTIGIELLKQWTPQKKKKWGASTSGRKKKNKKNNKRVRLWFLKPNQGVGELVERQRREVQPVLGYRREPVGGTPALCPPPSPGETK